MDTIGRNVQERQDPGRVMYELAGPADPTWDELSERMRRAWTAAARFVNYHQAVESLPSISQPALPMSPVDAFECKVGAAVSVLRRSELLPSGWAELTDVEFRALAEHLVAAIDTGI